MSSEQQPKVLEREIQELETRLHEKKSMLERTGEEQPKKEVFKKTFREHFDAQLKTAPISQVPSSPGLSPVQAHPLAHEPEKEPEVKRLVEVALSRGINEAVKEAKKAANPHIPDDLHDVLVDHYYAEFVKRGILK
jgi:hypothetical protein